MYIELFLLDNAMMNMLICRLSAALCARRLPFRRALAFSLAGAVYALCACYISFLNSPPCKIVLCFAMGLAMPCKGVREYGAGLMAMFAAAFIIGGMAFFIVYATGGAMDKGIMQGGISIRLMLFIASAAAAIPGAARRLRQIRIANEGRQMLTLEFNGKSLVLPAMIDSGNSLTEPVTGLPVAVACIAGAEGYIPIPANTVGRQELLYGFRPDRAVFMGHELDIIVAIAKTPLKAALIPPAAVPDVFERKKRIC